MYRTFIEFYVLRIIIRFGQVKKSDFCGCKRKSVVLVKKKKKLEKTLAGYYILCV